MSSKPDLNLDLWGLLDWDAEFEKTSDEQQRDSEAYGSVDPTLPYNLDVDMSRETGVNLEARSKVAVVLSSTSNANNIDLELVEYPQPAGVFHPGWAPALSPPLATSNHSTAPEVMRWVRSPDIYGSLQFHRDHWGVPMREKISVLNASELVDFDVDLSVYKFPYGAVGQWNPLPPPLPWIHVSYPKARGWTPPGSSHRKEAETLKYSASEIFAIGRNVRMQLSGSKMSHEAGDESQLEANLESDPASKRDSRNDGDLSSNESSSDARLQDSVVDFGTNCKEASKTKGLGNPACIVE